MKVHKLNQHGVAVLELAVVIVVALIIGVVGVKLLNSSHAATNYLSKSQCQLRGRNWTGSATSNPCGNKCASGTGVLVTNATFNYCSNTLSRLTKIQCASLNRKWLVDGCARRANQKTTVNAPQCTKSNITYWVTPTFDVCDSSRAAFSCTITGSPSKPVIGKRFTVTAKIKNVASKTYVPVQGYSWLAINPADTSGWEGGGSFAYPKVPSIGAGRTITLSKSDIVPAKVKTRTIKIKVFVVPTNAASCSKTFRI